LAAALEVSGQQSHWWRTAALTGSNYRLTVMLDAEVVKLFRAIWRVVRYRHLLGVQKAEHK